MTALATAFGLFVVTAAAEIGGYYLQLPGAHAALPELLDRFDIRAISDTRYMEASRPRLGILRRVLS